MQTTDKLVGACMQQLERSPSTYCAAQESLFVCLFDSIRLFTVTV
jgi:hypothetical protein